MSERRTLKLIHFSGTAWLVLCLGYIAAMSLRQAGVHWWIIFSLSGYSAVLVFLLVSLYLFAIFRGVGKSQLIENEHPLTSTSYYTALYLAAPFLGCVAGCLGMIGVNTVGEFIVGIALGTLGTTFLVWVIVDPMVGVLEMLLPASRRHRTERLARIRALRQERQEKRKRVLKRVLTEEQERQRRWQEVLKPYAQKLAELLAVEAKDFEKAEREAIGIGVSAWQMGGLSCMEHLRNMAWTLYEKRMDEPMVCDYVSNWWDGIGNWRNTGFC
jgi:hypothetical protein